MRCEETGGDCMKVIDLTQTISNAMPVYPGTAPARLEVVNTYEKDGFRETLLSMTSHTGTHMDAPFHLFGHRTKLDEMSAAQFVGKALVIDCHDLQAGEQLRAQSQWLSPIINFDKIQIFVLQTSIKFNLPVSKLR